MMRVPFSSDRASPSRQPCRLPICAGRWTKRETEGERDERESAKALNWVNMPGS